MNVCRSCNSNNLFIAVSIGKVPIAGELSENKLDNTEVFSSDMLVCKDCGLGQISEDLDRSRLFEYYRFKTSHSSSYLKHARDFASRAVSEIGFSKNDWVLELASNDGYLLKIFKEYGVDVLGVDPAKNIAMYAMCDGIPTITSFFGSEVAKEILRIKGYPKLIVANNVLAHVPDINDFINGISILCNDNTIVSIENPSIMNILKDNQFDSIYHEHYSYLSAKFVDGLAKKFGLSLFNVENYPVHGGSNRYWLSKTIKVLDNVQQIINEEINDGLIDQYAWSQYNISLKNNIDKFKNKILNKINNKSIICGYAASGKASVIISISDLDSQIISAIADDSFEKQGKFMPGSNIPVVTMEEMLRLNPTDIIIFSWNIFEEIKEKILAAGYNNAKIWIWDEE